MLSNPILATVVTFALAFLWLRLCDFFAHRGWVSSQLSRKLIHIGTGPLFVLCWLLYPDVPIARYLAALVPFVITLQFALVGLGIWRDEAAVKAMSRSGDRREILRGPLIYGIVFIVLTIVYWKDSPIGVTALMLLCGGDGLAEVVGRRYGTTKLPWSPGKSWFGAVGMFMGGWLLTLLVLAVYTGVGEFPGSLGTYLGPVTIIALAGTLIETLPVDDFDNLTVPLAAVVLGHWLFGGAAIPL